MRYRPTSYRSGESIYNALTAALIKEMTNVTFESARKQRSLLDIPSPILVHGVDVANELKQGAVGFLVAIACEEHLNLEVKWDCVAKAEGYNFGAIPYFSVADDSALQLAGLTTTFHSEHVHGLRIKILLALHVQ